MEMTLLFILVLCVRFGYRDFLTTNGLGMARVSCLKVFRRLSQIHDIVSAIKVTPDDGAMSAGWVKQVSE